MIKREFCFGIGCVRAKSLQLCLTLCDSMNCTTGSPTLQADSLPTEPPGKPPNMADLSFLAL